jgi:hypothetical protein
MTGSRPFCCPLRRKVQIPRKAKRPDWTVNRLGALPHTAIGLVKGCYVAWNLYQRISAPQKMTKAKTG